jgi:hypothetical protein
LLHANVVNASPTARHVRVSWLGVGVRRLTFLLVRLETLSISRAEPCSCFSFHYSDLFFRQLAQFTDQLVNLLVRRRNLALDGGLVGRELIWKTVVVPIVPPDFRGSGVRANVQYANGSAFSEIPQAIGPIHLHLPDPLPINTYPVDGKRVVVGRVWVSGEILDTLLYLLANLSREFLEFPQSGLCDGER